MSGAHISPYEESQTRYYETLVLFKGSVPLTAFGDIRALTCNTLNDCFNK